MRIREANKPPDDAYNRKIREQIIRWPVCLLQSIEKKNLPLASSSGKSKENRRVSHDDEVEGLTWKLPLSGGRDVGKLPLSRIVANGSRKERAKGDELTPCSFTYQTQCRNLRPWAQLRLLTFLTQNGLTFPRASSKTLEASSMWTQSDFLGFHFPGHYDANWELKSGLVQSIFCSFTFRKPN